MGGSLINVQVNHLATRHSRVGSVLTAFNNLHSREGIWQPRLSLRGRRRVYSKPLFDTARTCVTQSYSRRAKPYIARTTTSPHKRLVSQNLIYRISPLPWPVFSRHVAIPLPMHCHCNTDAGTNGFTVIVTRCRQVKRGFSWCVRKLS